VSGKQFTVLILVLICGFGYIGWQNANLKHQISGVATTSAEALTEAQAAHESSDEAATTAREAADNANSANDTAQRAADSAQQAANRADDAASALRQ
jgi:hypothetical protein